DRWTDQPRVCLTVDPRKTRERGTALRQIGAVAIEEPITERAGHARTAVVRRASADADDESMRAAHRSGEDQLAGATGGRDARIALVLAQEREAIRGRHLDDGGLSIAEHPPLGLDLAQQRIVDARSPD